MVNPKEQIVNLLTENLRVAVILHNDQAKINVSGTNIRGYEEIFTQDNDDSVTNSMISTVPLSEDADMYFTLLCEEIDDKPINSTCYGVRMFIEFDGGKGCFILDLDKSLLTITSNNGYDSSSDPE